ncbi:transmembrane protein, putative [Medicago truncatula]|uniref:Beta-amylase n=1 Tax=Medicago truncatula TaxID=3880 RepID=G7IR67_MEDTR|nr:transmembrane protein, putative [Medicago truncatula]
MEKQHSAATAPEIIYATQHSAVEIVRGCSMRQSLKLLGDESPNGATDASRFQRKRRRCGSPVFVALPVKYVGLEGKIWRPKAMMLSLKALVVAGVEGVVVEIWWGGVELVMMAYVSPTWH